MAGTSSEGCREPPEARLLPVAEVTSNKSVADWGEIFNDHVLATAILDRLLHHATTLNIRERAID